MLYLDFETRSPLDLKKVGVYNYAACPETEIICTGYAYDSAPVTVRDGSPLDLQGQVIVGHNVGFEKLIIRHKWGLDLPWWRFIDTAALAARMSLPRSLGALAEALHLDQQKDAAGHSIMLKLARPRGGWADDEFWEEEEKPADFAALREYCRQDVEVARAVHRRLLPLSTSEEALYRLTGRMNDAGVRVDLAAIPPARVLLEAAQEAGEASFTALTGGPGVKSYALAAVALGMPNMRKPTVRDALRRPDLPERVRSALTLFQKLARSSPAKLTALQRRTSSDGRLRGSLLYCGAERTGRWSSGGVQLQNLPRGLGEGTDEAFKALEAGAFDICYDEPVGTIAEMLRGYFVGPFLIGDFSQNEARTLAWLAGQVDLLKAFAEKQDPYKLMAARIYGKPGESINKDERFMGKQVVLGCFAADTPVLTQAGWKHIVDVQLSDVVWDGVTWVRHRGLVWRGEREVIRCAGIGVTPEHLIWCGGMGWRPAGEALVGDTYLLRSALVSGNSAWKATAPGGSGDFWPSESLARATGHSCTTWIRTTFAGARAHGATHAPKLLRWALANATGGTPISWPGMTTAPVSSIGSRLARAGGGKTAERFSGIWSRFLVGMRRPWRWIGSTWTRATARGTFGSLLARRTWRIAARSLRYNGGSSPWRETCGTYDLAFAGPRNRYAVLTDAGAVLAHNCGYGMGWAKFQGMLDETYDTRIDAAFAMTVVETYRQNFPAIPRFWRKLEVEALRVVTLKKARTEVQPGLAVGTCQVGGVHYFYIEIPSGRRLYYAEPEVGEDGLKYWGRNPYLGGKWGRVGTWGGKLTENVVQATARDVMAEAMLRLDNAGFKLLMTVHDEIVAAGGDEAAFKQLMLEVPRWAEGLPVDAEVFSCARYRK